MEVLSDTRNYFDRDDIRLANEWTGGNENQLTNNTFENPVYRNPISNIPNVSFNKPSVRDGHIRARMEQKQVDYKVGEDMAPRRMIQTADRNFYDDDFEAQNRRERHTMGNRFNKMGSSVKANRTLDLDEIPVFKKKTDEQEVNHYNLHSRSVENAPCIYGLYKTAKRFRPQDIHQKHFADKYGTEEVEHWGRGRDISAVHKREMYASDQWRKKQKIPFDKRTYNQFNHEKSNIVTSNENISLNNNEIDLTNILNGKHTLNMKYYDRPEKNKIGQLPDENKKRFETDIGFINRDLVQKKPGFIPKFAGFVPSIAAENLYGDTFAKTTGNVHNDNFDSGPDHFGDLKYQTTYNLQFPKKTNGDKVLLSTSKSARPKTVDHDDMSTFGGSYTDGNLINSPAFSHSMEKTPKINSGFNFSTISKDTNRKKNLILKDGETRNTKNVIRLYNQRKLTKANTDSKDKPKSNYDQVYGRNSHPNAYKQGMDLNSHGTNRVNYLKELRKKKELWESNPDLIENFSKIKQTNEFKKEFPKVSIHKGDHMKYGQENYNFHIVNGKSGYARHEKGYRWHYN